MRISLSEQDYRSILSGIDRLDAAGSLDELAREMVAVVTTLIDTDHAAYTEADALRRRGVGFIDEPIANDFFWRHQSVWATYMHEHPVLMHFLREPMSGPRKISDFLSHRDYRRLGLYSEFYGQLDTEYQLVANVSSGADWSVGLVVNRSNSDFAERDREVLTVLQSHMRRCYATQRRRALVSDFNRGQLTEELHDNLMRMGLTRREAESLFFMAMGKSNPDMAALMSISLETVKQHVRAVLDKLGLPGRATAMHAVQREVLSQDLSAAPPPSALRG